MRTLRPCPCGLSDKSQHSLREAARCDMLKLQNSFKPTETEPRFVAKERLSKPIRQVNAR